VTSKLVRYMPPLRERWLPCLDGRLWYSQPRSFNDPWDGQFPFVSDVIWNERELTDSLSNHFSGTLKDLFRPPEPAFLERMETTRASLRPWAKAVSSRLESVATACFCTDSRSHLLWSYYGSSHSGVCLEYDCAGHFGLLKGCQLVLPARYASHFPSIQLSEVLLSHYPLKFVIELLFTKNLAWAHENEWRAVLLDRIGSALYDLPIGLTLTSVYAGCSMHDSDFARLQIDCESRSIPLKRLKRANGSYRLLADDELDDSGVLSPLTGEMVYGDWTRDA
jgi:Protein of unknown function (DUF2971)